MTETTVMVSGLNIIANSLDERLAVFVNEAADRLCEHATLTEKLRALSAEWKERSLKQEHDWYNDCSSINQFTEQLDEILGEE
jgi:hypothetical protein